MDLPFSESQFFNAVKWIIIIGGLGLEVTGIIYVYTDGTHDLTAKVVVPIVAVILNLAIIGMISCITDKNYLRIYFKRESALPESEGVKTE